MSETPKPEKTSAAEIELARLKAQFGNYIKDKEFSDAARNAGVAPEKLDVFKKLVGDRFGIDNGRLVYLEADGETPSTVSAERAMRETLRKELDFCYVKEDRRTIGANLKRSEMTKRQKTEFIAKNGLDKFLKLPLK